MCVLQIVSGIRQTIQDGHQDQADYLYTCITTSIQRKYAPILCSRYTRPNDLLLYVTCIALVACAFKSCLCAKFQILDLHAIFCAASACRRWVMLVIVKHKYTLSVRSCHCFVIVFHCTNGTTCETVTAVPTLEWHVMCVYSLACARTHLACLLLSIIWLWAP